jgi:hypothetical protein
MHPRFAPFLANSSAIDIQLRSKFTHDLRLPQFLRRSSRDDAMMTLRNISAFGQADISYYVERLRTKGPPYILEFISFAGIPYITVHI